MSDTMTVGKLKELLSEYDDNHLVVMSKDGEGNSYSPLADIEEYVYIPDSNWSGCIKHPELTDELISAGYEEEDAYNKDDEDGKIAVVLFPNN